MTNELLFLAKQLYSEYRGEGFLIKEAKHHAYDRHWELVVAKPRDSAYIANELQFITDALITYNKDGFLVDYAERVEHKGQPCWKLKVHDIEIDRQKEVVKEEPKIEHDDCGGCGMCEEREMLAAQEILQEDAEAKEEDDGVCSERQD